MNQYPEFVEDIRFDRMHAERSKEEQLSAMLQNLKQVFTLTTQKYEDLSQLIRAILMAGTNIFDLETGIVSRIDGEQYTVLDVVSPLDAISPQDIFPVEGTYCREVFNSGKVLGFPQVGELLFMQNHPVYQNLQLESYLSAPIWIDGNIYGTLNFTSQTPRPNGFSEHERDLITLMADAIANFILIRDREEKLNSANHKLKKFVGFVAHDLRNPLGCIQSLAKQGIKPTASTERRLDILNRVRNLATVTLEFVHSVLELSALGSGKIEPHIAAVELQPIVAFAEESLEELLDAKNSQVTVQCDQSLTILADPILLHQCITNLLANAIKYAPENSKIAVTTIADKATATVTMANAKEAHSKPKQDSDRYRSIGFGLDIANEVLAAHGSTLELMDSDDRFQASFSLPLATASI